MIFDWIKRAYNHPMWFPVLSAIAILSLAGTFVLVALFIDDQQDQERARIDADIASCERENELKGQVARIGRANDVLVTRILATVFSEANPETVDRLNERLADPFADYRAEVNAIEAVDCRAVTPGSTEPGD